MTSFGFQLYSLHGVDDPLPTVVERVGETDFEGVELAGLGEVEPDTVADATNAAGLEIAGAHVPLEALEEEFETTVEAYRRLGCEDVVVPWMDPEHFESVESVEAAAARLDAVADDLSEHDISLHYHNHDQEFVELNDGPALTTLLAETENVGLELDLGWAGAAGYDPLSYLHDHADRVRLVHLKDYDAESGDVVEVGDGDLDIEAAVDAVRDHGFDWLIYEAEERPDSYGTLDHAASVLDAYW
ncbi:sugar phosphate isomerase/epimerase family protein [Halogeometricum limi]|uniref:Sugar phosphate isomerase/epimerase n=1 Tax=Halogeometricum limi TaxID=555875 RepID=A0A1I6IDC5_9EURY|nr:sugar phosphate isomerase/epimerase [Halogeometricum limi]SFR64624.1 Sugar phosphate isomerase/epimerase [Halogeometricum limi]